MRHRGLEWGDSRPADFWLLETWEMSFRGRGDEFIIRESGFLWR